LSSTTQQQHEEEISRLLSKHYISDKKPVCIIAVPVCHERLYSHIEKEHKWLSETSVNNTKRSWGKKINTDEEKARLEQLIMNLRTEKSEIFIDREYHPKPHNQSMVDYMNDFLRTKGVNTHYTFTSYYHVTVFPSNVKDINSYLRTVTPESDTREEYLIIPLLIRLKRGKTFEQSKMVVGVDKDTGEVIIETVNPKHFYKERADMEEEEQERDRRERLDRLMK
jgi:hypothetical protein